ncbi:MAG: Crp/Fnr family transcriptional regulator [Firmicutes bacterium]|nr:Crp/Fnr family transcriptional regulator [Bacillota bacterium]
MRTRHDSRTRSYISQHLPNLPVEIHDALLACGVSTVIRSGSNLFHQGDPAEKGYLILKGRLKLTQLHERGKEVILGYFGPGDLIAFLTAYDQTDYPATAEAVETVELVGWDAEALRQLIRTHPPLADMVLRMAAARMKETQKRYLELCAEQVDGRLARALLRIMNQAGRKTENGIVIEFPLSREDLADYIGTSLYTVSRTLSLWEKKGWVVSGRERITVTDPHALMAFAEGVDLSAKKTVICSGAKNDAKDPPILEP